MKRKNENILNNLDLNKTWARYVNPTNQKVILSRSNLFSKTIVLFQLDYEFEEDVASLSPGIARLMEYLWQEAQRSLIRLSCPFDAIKPGQVSGLLVRISIASRKY